ncbi:hypothetical protein GE061_003723 [Apolygus lucorum]|uniref:Peptidase S1 domain-containing protein n=1 Tax=Apolygus lucorum TaxID=248454 RepID=A0A6A4JU91_APOLU|nr:hypothetical protein GE061_003723 [Apolygus lucorum]
MWRSSIFGLVAVLVCFPGSLNAAECLLNVAMYMPFLVRVVQRKTSSGATPTLSTGSIITPKHVLTTCVEIKGQTDRDLEARASQGHYQIGKIDENHFKQIGPDEDKKGCIQIRVVSEIHSHDRCPLRRQEWMAPYTEEYTRYNVAILIVEREFRNYTEAVPALPFLGDIGAQFAQADDFNILRNERCEIPLYYGTEPKVKFHKDMSFRSLPLLAECTRHMCNGQPEICNVTMANSTGYILCASRVKQPDPGVTWDDYKQLDKDYYSDKEDACKDLKHTAGSPLMCRGSFVGMVTECNSWGMVISTIYTLRNYLHKYIEKGYTEEVVYMDAVTSTKSVRSDFEAENFEEEEYSEEIVHSNSNPLHEGLLEVGLGLLAMNVVFYLAN